MCRRRRHHRRVGLLKAGNVGSPGTTFTQRDGGLAQAVSPAGWATTW